DAPCTSSARATVSTPKLLRRLWSGPSRTRARTEFDRYGETYEAAVDEAISFAGKEHDFYLEAKARRLLELARRHLGTGRPSALAFEHNPLNPLTRRVVRDCAFDEGVELLGRRELERLYRGAGLEILGAEYLLFSPWRMDALERRLTWLPLGAQYVVAGTKT